MAAVGQGYLAGNVQPKAKTGLRCVVGRACIGLEDIGQEFGRDGFALVRDREPENPIQDQGFNPHRTGERTMGNGIGQQVGEQLSQTATVTLNAFEWSDVRLDPAVGMNALYFRNHVAEHLIEIEAFAQGYGDSAAEAASSKVQYVLY